VALALTVEVAALNSAVQASAAAPVWVSGPAAVASPGPAEAPDVVSARLMARLQNRRIEVLSERAADSSTFVKPDGSLTTEAYAGPVRVKQDDGSWKSVDTDLVDAGDHLAPQASAADVAVSDGGDKRLVEVTQGARTLGLNWGSTLPAPSIDGNTASYDLGGGARLTVEALTQGFEQSVVLDKAPTDPVSYRIPLTLKGLSLSKDATTGRLLLKDTTGKAVAEASAPHMWDSSLDRASGEPEHQAKVETTVEQAADGTTTLVLTPDPKFFTQDLTYPVTIDPSSSLAVTTDTWVQNPDYPDSQLGSQELKSGSYDGGADVARSYLKFNVAPFAGKHITSARMSLYSFYSSSCSSDAVTEAKRVTSPLDTTTVTWGVQPSTTTSNMATNTGHWGYNSSCAANWSHWTMTPMVQDWADGAANYGIQVRSSSESDPTNWRRFRSANYTTAGYAPKLEVDYNTAPGTPASLSPATGTATSDATPALSSKSTDADGNTVQVNYEIWKSDGTAAVQTGKSVFVNSDAVANWTPATALAGGSYKWRTRSYDGTDYSAWSSWQTLTVDTTAPAAPTLTSSSHPSSNSWYATKDFAGTLSDTAASGIAGYAVTLDQTPTTPPGGTVTQTGSGISWAGRPDGTWWVHAAAQSKSGLWSPATDVSFNVDTTAPGVPTGLKSSTHPLSTSAYSSTSASFSWTAPADLSGVAGYAVTVDNSPTTLPATTATFQTGTSYSTTVGGSGTWYLHVRTKDKAGNWSAGAGHFGFTVDTTLTPTPSISSTTHPDQGAAYTAGDFSAAWTKPSGAAGYSVTVDDKPDTVPPATVSTTGTTFSTTKADGTWYLHVRAVDDSGTWGSASHYRFTVDTTAPAAPGIASSDYPADAWAGAADTPGLFTITPPPADAAALRYQVDGGSEVTVAAGGDTAIQVVPSTEGLHTLTAWTDDLAGNRSAARVWKFYVGSAGIDSPDSDERTSGAVDLLASAPQSVSTVTFAYRRTQSDPWTTVPAADVTDLSEDTAVTWPAAMSDGSSPKLLWNAAATLGGDGTAQVVAQFGGPDSPPASRPVDITVDHTVDNDPEQASLDTYVQQEGADSLDRQEALESFKTWLLDQPGIDTSGFIESVNDSANKSMTLLWHGDSPLQNLAAEEAAKRGISLTFEQRQYDSAQLVSAMDATYDSAASGGWPGFQIAYIAGVTEDFDGIVVHGSYTDAQAGGTAFSKTALAQVDSVPVRIVTEEEAETATATRQNDSSPFYAGGYMLSPRKQATCSTGFAVKYGGKKHITTARHCDASDYRARDGRAKYGSSIRTVDSGGARILNGSGTSLMYDGAWNNRRGYVKSVVGYRDLGLGDKVCTSGGNSGVHCNIKVDAMLVRFDDGFGSRLSTIHGTQKTRGAIATIQGDSGGPVLTTAGDGKVRAAGMIQAVDHYVSNCGSVHDGGGNKCGTGVLFTSMRTIVHGIPGGSLVTS
jgi:hypothetical protein